MEFWVDLANQLFPIFAVPIGMMIALGSLNMIVRAFYMVMKDDLVSPRPVSSPPPVRSVSPPPPVRPQPTKWRCAYCNGVNPKDAYQCQHCTAPRQEIDND